MRCLTCKYDLRKLTEHRCPECGPAFDPDDANSFDVPPPRALRVVPILLLAVGVYFVLFGTHFYHISNDTTYYPDASSSPSQWGLGFIVIAANVRAFEWWIVVLPIVIVPYIAVIVWIIRQRQRNQAHTDAM